ncbi:DUF5906 domain-containing protein [Chitiniphilus eburneus]|uniref:NrS-1 polymerase-like helicase domain-containing protein n=1 Tax=Chitiniphilus eburneus TaxID=2571148 RepID=A0A4U0PX90_9NEIS|nr:DUF5906 domain-containing protein [Chitiniphilus eburneus]TJZ73181.1 hypothetical protein FAZ21_11220 [Chitiniphilus eburneus]
MASSLQSVIEQFVAKGLPPIQPHEIKVNTPRWQRYGARPKGEKPAYYKIRTYRTKAGNDLYFGNFGIGGSPTYEIEPDHDQRISDAEWAELQAKRHEAEEKDRQKRAAEARRAAGRAQYQWQRATDDGESAYAIRKGLVPEGVRYFEGVMHVPLYRYDEEPPRLVGLQKITPQKDEEGLDKFLNRGMDPTGAALLLGQPIDGQLIMVAEGYATGMSARMGLQQAVPVAVALNSGNLIHVARVLRRRFPASPIMVLADDDYLPTKRGEENHAGRKAAQQVVGSMAGCHFVLPTFTASRRATRDDELRPHLTDFNDLHLAEGLSIVAEQLRNAIAAMEAGQASPLPMAPEVTASPMEYPAVALHSGVGVDIAASPSSGVEVATEGSTEGVGLGSALRDFALIRGKRRVWHTRDQLDMTWSAFEALVGKPVAKAWQESKAKRQIKQEDVASILRIRRRKQREEAERSDEEFMSCVERYIYLDGSDSVWDAKLREILPASAVRMAMGKGYDLWVNSPHRLIIPKRNVVFDPTQRVNADTHVNLFQGLPMVPAKLTPQQVAEQAIPPQCAALVELSQHLCNYDALDWIWLMQWLAYPLQNVGAKMATAVLMHSNVMGSGKSWFFEEVIKPLYGDYSATLGQHQLDSQYTGWRSRKLFCLFEEVFSADQRYSHTGVLKHMVTGKTQNIEKKFVDSWEESNHMNAVFLSNHVQPFHVEWGDRRYLVIWPKAETPFELKQRVDAELKADGLAWFYAYLLNFPMEHCYTDSEGVQRAEQFHAHTKPPLGEAKLRLIDYGMAGWELFVKQWESGVLDVPFVTGITQDVFALYHHWAQRNKESSRLTLNKFSTLIGTHRTITKTVKKFRTKTGIEGRNTVFKIGHPPRGTTEADFLGAHIVRFREATIRYGVPASELVAIGYDD